MGTLEAVKIKTIYANVFIFYETEITWAVKYLHAKLYHKHQIARGPVRYDELRLASDKQCHDR